ncbi:LacI family DNA-binding transcriptional regulator [Schaalia sp. Marseille-Q2122]|uniref:LacI family DNA-binding transcriptional regulator n=1 Tax=Schaalia sp. Marseille-Q2122 TaxID=2736604 RepID=UPI0015896F71|nr:LacI family DNA-binding transcriptional regulator [Schaalia sp. Marseille-Q2122]
MSHTRVTLRDIAEAVGTSISTVSLALRDDARVSDKLRHSIQATAQELGYKVDLLGSMMRSNTPHVLGVVGRFDQELHTHYIRILGEAARERGYYVIAENAAAYDHMTDALKTLAQFRITTTIAINPSHEDHMDTLRNGPTVVIGQERVFPGADLMTSRNTSGAEELAAHLYALGHRSVAYFDGASGVSAQTRKQALERAFSGYNIRFDVFPAGATMDDGFTAASHLMADQWAQYRHAHQESTRGRLGEYSAIVGYNDQCVQGIAVALMGAGLRIPADVSLAGFDNSQVAQSSTFNLTSVDRGVEEIAALALDRAIERISTPELEAVTVGVDSHLVIRSSTARAYYLNTPAPTSATGGAGTNRNL